MLKSKTQTPVFDAAAKAQDSLKLEPKTQTDLEKIMLVIDNSDYVITIDGGGSKTSVQVLDTHTMQVVDLIEFFLSDWWIYWFSLALIGAISAHSAPLVGLPMFLMVPCRAISASSPLTYSLRLGASGIHMASLGRSKSSILLRGCGVSARSRHTASL